MASCDWSEGTAADEDDDDDDDDTASDDELCFILSFVFAFLGVFSLWFAPSSVL